MVELGDTKPTSQMYSVFHELLEKLGELSQQLEIAKSADVAHLNEQLKKMHLDPIEVPHKQ
jgi:hypothetical protein